jgi:hypothetical protein
MKYHGLEGRPYSQPQGNFRSFFPCVSEFRSALGLGQEEEQFSGFLNLLRYIILLESIKSTQEQLFFIAICGKNDREAISVVIAYRHAIIIHPLID